MGVSYNERFSSNWAFYGKMMINQWILAYPMFRQSQMWWIKKGTSLHLGQGTRNPGTLCLLQGRPAVACLPRPSGITGEAWETVQP